MLSYSDAVDTVFESSTHANQAITKRLAGLTGDPERDAQALLEIAMLASAWATVALDDEDSRQGAIEKACRLLQDAQV